MIIHLRARNLGAQTAINAFGDHLDSILKRELKAVRTRVVCTKSRLPVLEVELPDCPLTDEIRVIYFHENQMRRVDSWLKDKSLDRVDLDGDCQ